MTQNFTNYCEIYQAAAMKTELLLLMVATNSIKHITDSKGKAADRLAATLNLGSCSSADLRIDQYFTETNSGPILGMS